TFLMVRSLTSLNGSAVSRINWICRGFRCSSPTRSLPSAAPVTSFASYEIHAVLAVALAHEDVHAVGRDGGQSGAGNVGLDGKLAPPAVDEHAEEDAAGTAEVGALVERGANCAAGVEHVVHDDDGAPVQIGKAGLADHRARADHLEIVAVERNVELAALDLDAFALGNQCAQTLCQRDSARL